MLTHYTTYVPDSFMIFILNMIVEINYVRLHCINIYNWKKLLLLNIIFSVDEGLQENRYTISKCVNGTVAEDLHVNENSPEAVAN